MDADVSTSEQLSIGIDIGGTNLRAAVVDGTGSIIDIEQLPTPSSVNALETAISHVVVILRGRHEVDAVGLAVAGFILYTGYTTTRDSICRGGTWRSVTG